VRHPDRNITSIAELVVALREQAAAPEVFWFRGHARENWCLAPSLARDAAHLARETELLKRFIQLAVPHLGDQRLPATDWEWIFLMQHHRVPTRLLDWSESPLTALWFAVHSRDLEDAAIDAALWCLSPLGLNREARFRGKLDTELPGFGKDEVLDSWLPDRQDQGLAQNPVAATGSRNSSRMAAQLGNFTISDRTSSPIDTIGARQHVWRLIIPAAAKPVLAQELRLLRLSELTLFPDLDRVADVTKELLA
jgi:hypothetical protein